MVYGETKYWGLYNYVSFLGPHFSSLVSVFLVMVAKLRALNMLKTYFSYSEIQTSHVLPMEV